MSFEQTIPALDAPALAELLSETLTAPAWAVPLMIWGAPGIGKSDLVREAAAVQGYPLIDLRLSQLEPTDLRGIPLHDNGKVRWIPPDELPDESRDGPRGVLFLDEINAAPPPVAAAAYQLILDRRLGAYRLPEGWSIVAAGNRLDDRGITYVMPAPLANRFMHVELKADADAWLAWAARQGVDPVLRDFMAEQPHWLARFLPEPEVKAFPSPRSWVFADRVIKRRALPTLTGAGSSGLDETTLIHIAACVGREAATALAEFVGSGEQERFSVAGWLSEPGSLAQLTDVSAQMDAVRAIVAARNQGRIRTDEALKLAVELPDDRLSFSLIEQLHQIEGDRLFDEPAFSNWVSARGALAPIESFGAAPSAG
ncbi:MAG: MoxR family ATPase [Halothiobacillus sp.]|nr:MoxR family ATPase [Halothiobacillus sp.]